MKSDIRHAMRLLSNHPGFTVVTVLTLALGIGANTALFSLISAVLLRPLPIEEPERVVQLWGDPGADGRGRNSVAGEEYMDWKEQNSVFESMSALRRSHLNLTGEGRPERLRCLQAGAEYLSVFRVPPLLGRGFLPEEEQPGRDKVALLTYALWQRSFAGDGGVVGRTIRLGGEDRVVIGVLPASPMYSGQYDIVVPFAFGSENWHRSRRDNRLRVVARLKDGVSLEQARAEMRAIKERLNGVYPEYKRAWSVAVVPLHEELTGAISGPLWILFAAVGCVLLIACANVAGLLLARNASRAKEIALRTALGATPGRVVRQLLTESLVLAVAGGLAGVLLALWGVRALVRFGGEAIPRAAEVGVDGRVLAFALVVSILTGLACGLLPALQVGRRDLAKTLRGHGGAPSVRSARILRGGLVTAELAVAMILLVGAGLLSKTLARLSAVPLGFEPEGILALDLSLDEHAYPDAQRRAAFLEHLVARVESLPGVEAAGTATTLPMSGATDNLVYEESRGPEHGCGTDYDYVSGHYYRAMGLRVLRGRVLTERDNSTSVPPSAVVNRALARELFGTGDAVGRRIRGPFNAGVTFTVVGVVADVHHRGLDRRAPARLYLPQAYSGFGGSLVVRTTVPPSTMAEPIRKAVFEIDPNQPVANVRTLQHDVARSQADRRLLSRLLGVFSAAAVLLASVGLYGAMAFWVGLRRRETGIRMALGAGRRQVVATLIGQGVKLVVAGVVLGLTGALLLTRMLTHLLYGVSPRDPLTFAATAALLSGTALLAAYIPARRTSRLDPMEALRCE